MTSKSLFFRLLKEDFKIRIWTLAVSILTFFFSVIVATAMMISMHMSNSGIYEYVSIASDVELSKIEFAQAFCKYISITNPFFSLVFIGLAMVTALSGFSYLYSKKKVDMYHSLPVKRETLFFIKAINGIIIAIVPFIVCALIACLMIFINTAQPSVIMATIWGIIGWSLVFFLNYSVVLLAIMLTGNMLIGILACVFFDFYFPSLSFILMEYQKMFLKTCYNCGSFLEKFLPNVSSVMIAFNAFKLSEISEIVISLIAGILLMFANLLLYRKRASETAGKSISFTIIKVPVKFMTVIFMSMMMYLLAYEIMMESTAWGIFGAVVSGVITHCTMEIIYNQDFKKIFAKKIQMLICIVISLILVGIFQMDLLGYDRYIPKVSDIKSVAVISDILESNESLYYNKIKVGKDSFYAGGKNVYVDYADTDSIESSLLSKTDIGNKEAVLELAKLGAGSVSDYYEDSQRVVISYKLKSGRTVQRAYNIGFQDMISQLSKIYDDEGYKKSIYPILTEDNDDIVSIDLNGIKDNDGHIALKDNNLKNRLMDAYKKDLLGLSYDTRMKSYPISSIRFNNEYMQKALEDYIRISNDGYDSIDKKYPNVMEEVGYYPVYPEFKDTISILNEMGVDAAKTLPIEDIDRIEVSRYYTPSRADEYYNEDNVKVFKDAKDIDKILGALAFCDSPYKDSLNEDMDLNVYIYLKADKDNPYGGSTSYHFKKGNVPNIAK